MRAIMSYSVKLAASEKCPCKVARYRERVMSSRRGASGRPWTICHAGSYRAEYDKPGAVMPDNHGEAIKILTGDDPLNRVAIVRRTDGYYAIRPERWDEEADWREGSSVGGWLPSEWESGIFESVTLAEKQAYAEYRWLDASKGGGRN
jgi:hypothetical protein